MANHLISLDKYCSPLQRTGIIQLKLILYYSYIQSGFGALKNLSTYLETMTAPDHKVALTQDLESKSLFFEIIVLVSSELTKVDCTNTLKKQTALAYPFTKPFLTFQEILSPFNHRDKGLI